MDTDRIDSLATTPNRRRLLSWLAAGLIARELSPATPAGAKKKGARRRKRATASASSTALKTVTIDFSTFGQGPFQADFYKKNGVIFTEGSFVGFIQGDEALIGNVAGTFTPPVSSLSARVAPGFQGTFEFTLTALSPSSNVIASQSVTVTEPPSVRYVTIDLGDLPTKAKYFTLTSTGIPNGFGTSSITFETTRKSG
jgi:hypothetical protein